MHHQLASELPERDGLRGLVVSASKEIEPGARAMLVLAEGLFRIDVVVHGDSLRTVVRNFTDGPLAVSRGSAGLNLAFGEVAVLHPGRADLEFTLGAGADRLRARVTMATLRFDERGTVRVSANALLRQDPEPAGGGRCVGPADLARAPPTIHPVARRLVILGCTGSIGAQALDVVDRSGGELQVVGLSAGSSVAPLIDLARARGVRRVALSDADAAARAAELWTDGEVLSGPDGLVELITESDCDLVLNAIVGSAGLVPTVATLGEGIDLALANKESLVVGGELVMALAEATGATIIPVDSEHSALHQLLAGESAGTVDRLILTASGGPFRGRPAAELEEVTVEQALAHPTWRMGGKITIDSATLMNKGLELIEAHHLFGTPYEQIDVVVHPQSIVHSLIQLCDGATLAHLGYPDMRVPIAYGLHYPERVDVPVRPLNLAELGSLTFEAADTETFGCLSLARAAGEAGGTAPCTLNAANEVAVHAFLAGRLRFLGIEAVIAETLEQIPAQAVHSFDSLARADAQARRVAGELVQTLTSA